MSQSIIIYKNIIKDTMYKTIPNCNERYVHGMYEKLLLDINHLWIYFNKDNQAEVVIITTVNKDYYNFNNILTIISLYAPDGTSIDSLKDIYRLLTPFAKKHNCHKAEYLVTNPLAERLFKKLGYSFKASYYQIDAFKED